MKFLLALSALLAAAHVAALPAAMPDPAPVPAPAAGAAPANLAQHEARDAAGGAGADDDDEELDEGTLSLLAQLEAVPDAVLDAGDGETAAWLAENVWGPTGAAAQAEGRAVLAPEALAERGALACVSAVSLAFASKAFPIITAARLVRLFAKYGNMRRTMGLLRGKKTKKAIREAGGNALVEIASILTGVGAIAAACWPGTPIADLL